MIYLLNLSKYSAMEANQIHIIYHRTDDGYACYSHEMDGLNTEGKTVEELMEKVTHLLNVRVAALEELGKNEEAEQLSERQVIFTKE